MFVTRYTDIKILPFLYLYSSSSFKVRELGKDPEGPADVSASALAYHRFMPITLLPTRYLIGKLSL